MDHGRSPKFPILDLRAYSVLVVLSTPTFSHGRPLPKTCVLVVKKNVLVVLSTPTFSPTGRPDP